MPLDRSPSRTLAALASALAALSCSDAGDGAAAFLLVPESNIQVGFGPSDDEVDMVDGWTVAYQSYLVSLGDLRIARSGAVARVIPVDRVADLLALPASGGVIAEVARLAAGRWDEVGYSLRAPGVGTATDSSVAAHDRDRMASERCSILVRGTLTKPGGESCPPGGACRAAPIVAFDLCLPANVEYFGCAAEGALPGVVVRAGATTFVDLTLHGDHFFFTRFPSAHALVERRAAFLVDADVDGDDYVDDAELASIDTPNELSLLFPSALGYDFSGSPIPVLDAHDAVTARMMSFGHFQGEGECGFAALP